MIGQRFSRWLVIGEAPKSSNGHIQWLCKCDCGEERFVAGTRLRTGASKSCGCFMREQASIRRKRHGMSNTQFHKAWQNILDRCNNVKSKSYNDYGGRGIYVCERWLSFENFKEDMYECYLKHVEVFGKRNTSIDRIDNDDGYFKENCRWATSVVQMNNRRIDKRNKSGYSGIVETEYGTWRAYVNVERIQTRLGTFKTKEEAISARKEAEYLKEGRHDKNEEARTARI